jgi:signal transduction histidine kinase/ActR/RegA family two-component response regulator
VVASLAEGVTMVDRAGRVLIVNDGARAIFGPRLANWLACRDTAAFARDAEGNSLSDADHPTGKAFASGRARRNTLLRLDRTEGDSVWILVNTQPLLDPASGATSAVVTSVIDVSEEREREQALGRARDAAEAASRVKSQFLANMSHEIRTPMNGVLGMAELLAADATLNDRQRHYLDVIRDSGESLLRVIDDILDFSKIEAGRLSLNAEEFDLRQRVAMTLGLMETRAHAKGLELTWTVADDVPSWMKGDAARLHQILANLVGNAVKFTERGAVRVTVELAADPRPSEELRRVRIAVSDTGIGIPPTYLPRMFRLFSQEDESNSRRFGGTGLGLAISRQLVELMGGEIGVESEPGKGSTFWFTVPLGEAAEPAGASRPAPVEARTRLSGRVLVVEDEPTNRLLARETLRVLGCVPEAVEDGQAALDWLAREACDVVLMDCQMPGLDGFETTARIRERGCLARNGGRIPIVALTASALSGDRDRCLAAGMDDYLSKPFSREALRATLLRWLPARGRQP